MTGTPVKFVPVTGTDSMQRSGIAHTISTKHHCITLMKEYESKSLEELRWEDYQDGRKGPTQNAFGAPQPFGAVASSAPSLFGQPAQDQSKLAFGQTPVFGQTPAFGTQTSAPSLFGKPTGFGTTTTTSSFGFGSAPSNNLFGSAGVAKPFSTQTSQPSLFGAPVQQQQQSSPFGTSNLFGQNNQVYFAKQDDF